jgi:hypothetical protein
MQVGSRRMRIFTSAPAAQARLQLQLWLREKQKEAAIRKQEHDICKFNGDTNALTTAREKLKNVQISIAMHVKMGLEGIPAYFGDKACRKWAGNAYTLAELLDDGDLDRRTEFGVNRDSLLEYTPPPDNSLRVVGHHYPSAQRSLTYVARHEVY